jgi:TolB protein
LVFNLKFKKYFLFFIVLFLGLTNIYAKDVYLNLTGSNSSRRVFICLQDFTVSMDTGLAKNIKDIIKNDLIITDLFRIESDANLKNKTEKGSYEDWLNRSLDYVFSGEIGVNKDSVSITGKLFDVANKNIILQKTWNVKKSDYRRASHLISDEIILVITGNKGLNSTKFVFVSDASDYKEVWIADYDGENIRKVTDNKSLTILPRWNPNGDKIIYTCYKDKNPDLYSYDLNSSTSMPLSYTQGLNTAAEYSRDGKKIALTMTIKGDPEICVLNDKGDLKTILTESKGIDTSPTWDPLGKQIAFISERTGVTQIYIVDSQGGKPYPITFDPTFKDSPEWSPKGDYIVFSSRKDRRWDIFVVNVVTKEISQLTKDQGNNENPSWSPDGSKICFSSTRNGASELFVMNADGSDERKIYINLKGRIITPKWSR